MYIYRITAKVSRASTLPSMKVFWIFSDPLGFLGLSLGPASMEKNEVKPMIYSYIYETNSSKPHQNVPHTVFGVVLGVGPSLFSGEHSDDELTAEFDTSDLFPKLETFAD